jgi:hypothetical protein
MRQCSFRSALTILPVVLGQIIFSASALAQVKSIEFKPRPGVVWFIASVTNDEDGLPSIDLGDSSGLMDGEYVALFRPAGGLFEPLGSVRIDTTYSTWSIPEKTSLLTPQAGDFVVFVRTLSQLGEASEFRDRFLEQQIAKKGIRNGYSTLQRQDQVNALSRISVRQPQWQLDRKPIAGHFRSPSVSKDDLKEFQPVLSQVMRFQDFSTIRVPIVDTAGEQWASVIDTLTPEVADAFPETRPYISTTANPQAANDEKFAEIQAKKAEEAAAQALEDAALKLKISRIQNIVETKLYSRPLEQRRVIVTLCAALEKFKPPVENTWFASELQVTQFPTLKDDPQFLADIAAVLRKVREEQ